MIIRLSLLYLVVLLLLPACAKTQADKNEVQPKQWSLPGYLREASGLVTAGTNFLYTHNDERGNIYRVDVRNGSVQKTASIGSPPVRKDFEGIAISSDALFLTTSKGTVYRTRKPNIDDEELNVGAEAVATGLSNVCEIEGLHYLDGTLLLPCKRPLIKKLKNRLVVFRYNLDTGKTSELFSIRGKDIPQVKRLRPTAIDSTKSHYYLVSANQLVLIDRNSHAATVYKLRKAFHRKIEGLAVLEDGAIFLVEDNRGGVSRLTIYKSLDELISLNDG